MQAFGPATLLKRNSNERLLPYFHYNSYHHYHHHLFHYYCKMHLYHLRILLTILLDCKMIPCFVSAKFCLLSSGIYFSVVLFQWFSFFTPSKRTQNSLTTSKQIYTYLLVPIYTYLFILMFSLYYYVNLIKLLKYGEYRNYDKIF